MMVASDLRDGGTVLVLREGLIITSDVTDVLTQMFAQLTGGTGRFRRGAAPRCRLTPRRVAPDRTSLGRRLRLVGGPLGQAQRELRPSVIRREGRLAAWALPTLKEGADRGHIAVAHGFRQLANALPVEPDLDRLTTAVLPALDLTGRQFGEQQTGLPVPGKRSEDVEVPLFPRHGDYALGG